MFLCAGLGMACLFDYTQRRIPNLLQLFLFLLGLGLSFVAGGFRGSAGYLLRCLVVVAVFFPVFAIGGIGAGDVKLLGISAGFLQTEEVPSFLFFAFLFAAVFAFVKMFREKSFERRICTLVRYVRETLRTGKIRPYHAGVEGAVRSGIVLSGPMFCSALLWLGGVY